MLFRSWSAERDRPNRPDRLEDLDKPTPRHAPRNVGLRGPPLVLKKKRLPTPFLSALEQPLATDLASAWYHRMRLRDEGSKAYVSTRKAGVLPISAICHTTRRASPYSAGPSFLTKSVRRQPMVMGNYLSGSSSEHRVCQAT